MQISEQAAIYRAVEVFERIRCLYNKKCLKEKKTRKCTEDNPKLELMCITGNNMLQLLEDSMKIVQRNR